MLTVDRQIDRRILQEADSLEQGGLSVAIVALPLDGGVADPDPRIRRATAVPCPTAHDRSYAFMRRLLPDTGLTAALKAWAWRYLVDFRRFHLRLFESALANVSPSIVIAHDLPTLPAACALAQSRGAKLVYDSHELYCEQSLHPRERRKWRDLEASLIRRCDAVVTVNPAIAAELRAAYGIDQVEVVMNAEPTLPIIAGQPRHFHEAFKLAETDRVLLYQGGLQRDRNLGFLLDVVALLDDNVHLVFLGDGELEPELRREVERSHNARRVHFHPRVEREELRRYTSSADIGLIPYLGSCLNNLLCVPNKLFEFISAGVPMVASDLPEIRRLVTQYGLGLLADFREPGAVAGAIKAMLEEKDLAAQFRQSLRAAATQLNWENEGAKFAAIIQRLIKAGRTTAESPT